MRTDKEAVELELMVLRCRRNERGAWDKLIHDWEQRLFYYIRQLVGQEEDAWDILQQTWLKAVGHIDKLREPRTLPAWLYKIAHNNAMNHLRRRRPQELLDDKHEALADPDCHKESIRFDDAQEVHWGLGKLPIHQREVLTLHFLDDLAIAEIAIIQNVSPGTVKSRIYTAKRALREILNQESHRDE